MRRLRARVSVARRRLWRLQGPIQPRRHAVRPVGLRRRRAVRSDREEAVLPRQSRRAGVQLWHAWLRSPLRLLSELGHLAGPARSVSRLAPTDGDSRGPRCRRAGARRAGARLDLQRAARSRRSGPWRSSRRHARRASRRRLSRTATRHRKCWTTCARTSTSTRSISSRSTIATIASSAAGSRRSSTRSVRIHDLGLWLEIVTLLIPGFNDSEDELKRLTAFVAEVSPDIPWHVTAFHADYKMTDRRDTSRDDLLRAAAIGRDAGLRFVYAGNRPGEVGDLEDTRCPSCRATVGVAAGLSRAGPTR